MIKPQSYIAGSYIYQLFISKQMSNFFTMQSLTLLDLQILEKLWCIAANFKKNVTVIKIITLFFDRNFHFRGVKAIPLKGMHYKINQTAKSNPVIT